MALYGGNILTATGRKRRSIKEETDGKSSHIKDVSSLIYNNIGWRQKTEKAIAEYGEEMKESFDEIINDLEAIVDLETFDVDVI